MLRLMQLDLDYAIQNNNHVKGQIESCYEISDRYWTTAKQKLIKFEFHSKQEEIFFFKKIKPAFTSEIEYFKLLYNLEVVITSDKQIDKFLLLERKRLQRFINHNSDFYAYYKDDRSDLDETYFLRANNKSNHKSNLRPYDNEKRARTSHDHLVAAIKALEKYEKYLQNLET